VARAAQARALDGVGERQTYEEEVKRPFALYVWVAAFRMATAARLSTCPGGAGGLGALPRMLLCCTRRPHTAPRYVGCW
jgi:hypothetical protein